MINNEFKCLCIDCNQKCYEYYNNATSNKSYYEWTLKEDKCIKEKRKLHENK